MRGQRPCEVLDYDWRDFTQWGHIGNGRKVSDSTALMGSAPNVDRALAYQLPARPGSTCPDSYNVRSPKTRQRMLYVA